MRAALTVGRMNLRRLFSDRSVLLFTVVLPLTLLFVIGRGTERVGVSEFEIGVVGTGPVVDALKATDGVSVETVTAAKASRRVQELALDAVVDVTTTPVGLIVSEENSGQAAIIAIVGRAASVASRPRLAAVAAGDPSLESRAQEIDPLIGPVDVKVSVAGTGEGGDLTGPGYQGPAQLVLFTFITSVAASSMLVNSRKSGVLARQFASPVAAVWLVAGEGLGRFAIAVGQALFIVGASVALFRVDWGDPLAAAALIVVFAALSAGIALMVGSYLNTPEQASTVGPLAGIGLGMLGGCMWPLEIVPGFMRTVGHLTPHAWAMDAWIKITIDGAGVTGIAVELAVLGVAAAAAIFAGSRRLRAAAAG